MLSSNIADSKLVHPENVAFSKLAVLSITTDSKLTPLIK